MIIKFSPLRLSIIIFLVILFPLVQKQWLNLYLFDINNFSIYKLLYYLSGLIVPIIVIINSLNKFTYYKFDFHKKNNNNNYNFDISGKNLLVITLVISSILSILISRYIFINFKIILNFFLSNNESLIQFDIDKQIIFVVIITILLIFKKTKFFIKKIILTNFFIFSIINWYSLINNFSINEVIPFYIFKFGNINILNIVFLLAIEMMFYLWSYISYNSYLSDWNVPKPYKKEITPILNIIIFYLLIILYYSILF